jgi:hypothetical protein
LNSSSESEQTRGNPGTQSYGASRRFHRLTPAEPPEILSLAAFYVSVQVERYLIYRR